MSKTELVKKMVKRVRGTSSKEIIIDNHCHIFNYDCLANELTDRYTMKLSPKFFKNFLGVFNNPFNNDDFGDRAQKFFEICAKDNTVEVAKELLKESKFKDPDKKLICTLLMMDTEYAANDHTDSSQLPKKSFLMQKREMMEVTLKHKGVFLPFIAADPRRIRDNKRKGNTNDRHGIKYITDALERQGFWGVKIYPPLGYLPNNSFFRPLYKYCNDNEIPITAHCLHGGFYSAQDIPANLRGKTKKSIYYWEMANPVNWKPVLDKYPNLKLNLGHFGGDIFGKKILVLKDEEQIRIEKEWRNIIVSYLKEYNNVYADIAYIEAMFCEPDQYFKRLKKYSENGKILKKILYGTDWWANRTLCSESEHLETFSRLAKKHKIGDDRISCLLKGNAVTFLGLNNPASGPLFNHINFLASRGATLPTWFKFS